MLLEKITIVIQESESHNGLLVRIKQGEKYLYHKSREKVELHYSPDDTAIDKTLLKDTIINLVGIIEKEFN